MDNKRKPKRARRQPKKAKQSAEPRIPAAAKKKKRKPAPKATTPRQPESLRASERIERILVRTRDTAQASEETRQLHRWLRETLEDVQAAERGEDPLPPSGEPNRVLLYLASVDNDEEPNDALVEKARSHYCRRPDDYDVVLGELIPADFRKEARTQISPDAYFDGTNRTAADDWDMFCNIRDQRHRQRGSLLGLPTGIPSLDKASGGVRCLTFIGGNRQTGKTSLLLFVLVTALEQRSDLSVLLYSLDMPKTRIYKRLLSLRSRVDYRKMVVGKMTEEERQRVAEAEEWLKTVVLPRLRVVERFSFNPRRGLSGKLLIQHSEELLVETETSQLLVGVDLFQRMDVPQKITGDFEKDDFRLDALKQLQTWSRSDTTPDGFPIMAISQVRKGDRSRKELTSEDLLNSGRLAFDAEQIWLLWPKAERRGKASDTVPLTLRIDKGRDGGITTDLRIDFHHTCYQFADARKANAVEKGAPSGVSSKPKSTVQCTAIDPLAGSGGGRRDGQPRVRAR